MTLRLEVHGPHNPAPGPPPRAPGSVRRTSAITTSRPSGATGAALLEGRARDLRTTPGGGAAVAGAAMLRAVIDPATRGLASLATEPVRPELADLIGVSVASGFRRRVDDLAPALGEEDNRLHLLLDDLPGAALVGGYALLRADVMPSDPPDDGARRPLKIDICSGWADSSVMIAAIRQTGQSPTPYGPPAPPLADADDPWAWPALDDPGVHGMRRVRRLDVGPRDAAGTHAVDGWFRDSHWSADEGETVVHEYSVRATFDPRLGVISAIAVSANVLPWPECPAAVASARRVVGQPLTDLRQWVRREMTGTSTCTHLNDTLRSLADVGALLDLLP